MTKSIDDLQVLGKDGVEAYVTSATALTKGFQAIAIESADYSRKSFEKGTEALEKVMSAKSLDKAVEAQQGFAKEAYESYMSQMNRIGELYLAAAKDAYKPFQAQLAQFGAKATSTKG